MWQCAVQFWLRVRTHARRPTIIHIGFLVRSSLVAAVVIQIGFSTVACARYARACSSHLFVISSSFCCMSSHARIHSTILCPCIRVACVFPLAMHIVVDFVCVVVRFVVVFLVVYGALIFYLVSSSRGLLRRRQRWRCGAVVAVSELPL